MAIMSLAEAKAELEQQEQEESQEQKPEKRETLKLPEKKAPEPPEEPEEVEQTPDETAEAPSDDWMKGDDEEEGEKPEESFTSSDVAKVRRKFKGRLKAEKDENEKLREEIAALKNQVQTVAAKPAAVTAEPKREQFKTDEDYQKALTIHLLDEREKQRQNEQSAAQRQQEIERARSTISQNVEAHYTRRAELAKKSNITDEAMGVAEQAFRQAIDDVRPGMGDAIADGLISMLGKGSEMVIHKLGVSRATREKAAEALRSDPSGLALAAFMGELKASLTAPMKRESRAPEPPTQIQGDKTNNSSHSRLIKEYEAAQKSGNAQREWDARKALKAAGVDVSKL